MVQKILITGVNGFLGSRVLEDFVAKGFDVTGTARQPKPTRVENGFRYIAADLTDPACVDILGDEYDCIIHCAAKSSPWGAYQDFFDANITASRHLLTMARKYHARQMVLISTPSIYFVYGDRFKVKESDPLADPMINHYATTKYMAEQELLRSELPVIALRPRALIGRGDTVIIPRLFKAYNENKLKIIGNGHNTVDMTPVANVVHAVHCAMKAPEGSWNQAYNITAGQPVKLWDTISLLFHQLGMPAQFKKVPYFMADWFARYLEWTYRNKIGQEPALTRYSVAILKYSMTLDITKARELIGYQPIQSVEDGMQEFISWWQSKESHDH